VTVTLRGAGLTEDQVVAVARHGEKVTLAPAARTRMERSRERVERAAASREPVYGVSTGFGALAGTRIAPLRQPELQLALIRSHAAGVGPPVDQEVVRATMLLRARTLAMGLSGVRPVLAEALIAMLNEGITPLVPRFGSVGCSGDLAPLAHIGLALVGEGRHVGLVFHRYHGFNRLARRADGFLTRAWLARLRRILFDRDQLACFVIVSRGSPVRTAVLQPEPMGARTHACFEIFHANLRIVK